MQDYPVGDIIWGPYNSHHKYGTNLVGRDSQYTAYIRDCSTCYWDNGGGLTVTLFGPGPMIFVKEIEVIREGKPNIGFTAVTLNRKDPLPALRYQVSLLAGCDCITEDLFSGHPVAGALYQEDVELRLHLDGCTKPVSWIPKTWISYNIEDYPGQARIVEPQHSWDITLKINVKPSHPYSMSHLGEKKLLINLRYKHPDTSKIINSETVEVPLWIFFDAEARGEFGGYTPMPNWFTVWNTQTDAGYTAAEYVSDLNNHLGEYDCKTDTVKVGPLVMAGDGFDVGGDHYGVDEIMTGIEAFAMTIRHEREHQRLFREWWETYSKWVGRYIVEDPDQDLVPTFVELEKNLDPNFSNTNYPDDPDWTDFEEFTRPQEMTWANAIRGKLDEQDFAFPGKQTLKNN